MSPETFVKAIRATLIEDDFEDTRRIFLTTNVADATDAHWIQALQFFNRLSDRDKNILFGIIKQAQIDTVARFLAVLDSTIYFAGHKTDFKLIALDNEDEIINADLADLFLAEEEP